jgi:hypothetical protein
LIENEIEHLPSPFLVGELVDAWLIGTGEIDFAGHFARYAATHDVRHAQRGSEEERLFASPHDVGVPLGVHQEDLLGRIIEAIGWDAEPSQKTPDPIIGLFE